MQAEAFETLDVSYVQDGSEMQRKVHEDLFYKNRKTPSCICKLTSHHTFYKNDLNALQLEQESAVNMIKNILFNRNGLVDVDLNLPQEQL